MTATAVEDVIRAEMPEPFHDGWNRFSGVTVTGNIITIHPAAYFLRYENTHPTWLLCDWEGVSRNVLGAQENTELTLEQIVLNYIRTYGRSTDDPAKVLTTAWPVYSYLFREEHLADPEIKSMGVTPAHLRMLTEMGTVMALNRVELNGAISNVGPAWMFADACKVVFGIEDLEATLLDELYHGTWFNESRRREMIRAHAALGGRLVHGCQSQINMAGGCVVPFGADVDRFARELSKFRPIWIEQVRACAE